MSGLRFCTEGTIGYQITLLTHQKLRPLEYITDPDIAIESNPHGEGITIRLKYIVIVFKVMYIYK